MTTTREQFRTWLKTATRKDRRDFMAMAEIALHGDGLVPEARTELESRLAEVRIAANLASYEGKGK